MSDEIKTLVDRRWSEYGIEAGRGAESADAALVTSLTGSTSGRLNPDGKRRGGVTSGIP
jgi:hypothetical protein